MGCFATYRYAAKKGENKTWKQTRKSEEEFVNKTQHTLQVQS